MSHPLLRRQLKKLGLSEEAPPTADGWRELLERVSRSYTDSDQERYLRLRSQDLAEKELRALTEDLARARDQAIALATVKSEFLANISHEIRTPLNGVIGMCTLLVDTELAPEQRDLATGIRSSGEALLAVVNDVLDLSKLEAGRVELETVPYSPRTIAEEVGDIVASRAHEVGLELVIDVADDVPATVIGDPTRLRQILLNLTNNAVKFTREGEVHLTAWVEDRPSDRSARLRFDVRDTGIGIPADRLPRLFEAFSQVDASTTRKYGGTGLGLAICKRLATAMSGVIQVESEEGRGSTFSFALELPVVESTDAPPVKLGAVRVLAVDRSETGRQLLRRLLAGFGCQATVVSTDDEVITQLVRARAQGSPMRALVVSDPVRSKDPHTLARALAERSELEVPLVLATDLSRTRNYLAEDRLRYKAVVGKPLKRDTLRRAVASVVGANVSSAPARVGLTEGSEQRRGRRVLVVDDNAINRRVLGKLLELAGFGVRTACDGEQALAALSSERFDAVLMDCQMPVMDGFAATRELRRREGDGRRTPVIAVTAGAMSTDRDACIAAQMDGYLTKPVRSPELVRMLDDLIPPTGHLAKETRSEVNDVHPAP